MKKITVSKCSLCPYAECMTHGVLCEKAHKVIGLYSEGHMSDLIFPDWCPLEDEK